MTQGIIYGIILAGLFIAWYYLGKRHGKTQLKAQWDALNKSERELRAKFDEVRKLIDNQEALKNINLSLQNERDAAKVLLVAAEEAIGHLSVCGRPLGCSSHAKAHELRSRLIECGYISDITASGLPWHPKYAAACTYIKELSGGTYYYRGTCGNIEPWITANTTCPRCGLPIKHEKKMSLYKIRMSG